MPCSIAIMAAGSITVRARSLFAGLGGDYDRWSAILSLGQDPRWRRFLVSRVDVPASAHVLDVACGTGLVTRELLRRRGCRVTALDQSPAMLAGARAHLATFPGGDGVELVEGRAEALPFAPASFDGLTVTYLLRYVDDVDETLAELARVLAPGAPFAYLEFALPPTGPARWAWHLYTGVGLPLAGRLISPAWHDVGRFLRPSILAFSRRYPPRTLAAAFARAGFVDVDYRTLSLSGGIVVWGRRRGD
jgi:demethylmenaquinone methyltransferase/2-methoxy-6-polyprenyl-1,4-benzoquinol methylase